MKTHDRLGRRLFSTHTTNPIPNFYPDARQIRWMQYLNLHGLASSKYLHEFTADTHSCPQTSKRQLRRLFDGQMVYKPRQQRETENADGNHHIYDLTEKGKTYLKQNRLWVNAHRPTGPWVHQFMVSCITGTVHILCEREGYNFIPGHEITSSLSVEVPFNWKGKKYSCKLIPDSLFAIRYGKGYIAYALEADRNTEPNDPATPFRKSARRNFKQYAEFVGRKIYRKQFGLNCPLVVLNVTVSGTHIEHILQIVDEEIGECSYMVFGSVDEFRTPFHPPREILSNLFEGPLLRNRLKPFLLTGQ